MENGKGTNGGELRGVHGTRGGATWRHRRHPHRAVSHRRETTSTEVRTFKGKAYRRTEPVQPIQLGTRRRHTQARPRESVTHHVASSQLSRTQTAHPIEFGIATETTRADVRAPDASTLRPPGCGWKPSMSRSSLYSITEEPARDRSRCTHERRFSGFPWAQLRRRAHRRVPAAPLRHSMPRTQLCPHSHSWPPC